MYNILILGATGVGKSTLINKLQNNKVADIGYGASPKTSYLDSYSLTEQITIWDTPGLGEGIKEDEKNKKKLKKILNKKDFIDLILIVIDVNNKAIDTTSELINFILETNEYYRNNFIFILNKVDEAKNFRYWKNRLRRPSKIQQLYINKTIEDVSKRIEENTKIKIKTFLNCSADEDYNIKTISNEIYSYILNKHIKGR